MIISLEKAKEFEALVKRVLMSKYGKMLPSDKVTLLNTTEFWMIVFLKLIQVKYMVK